MQLLSERYAQLLNGDVEEEMPLLKDLLASAYKEHKTNQVIAEVITKHSTTLPQLTKLASIISVIPVSTAGLFIKPY